MKVTYWGYSRIMGKAKTVSRSLKYRRSFSTTLNDKRINVHNLNNQAMEICRFEQGIKWAADG